MQINDQIELNVSYEIGTRRVRAEQGTRGVIISSRFDEIANCVQFTAALETGVRIDVNEGDEFLGDVTVSKGLYDVWQNRTDDSVIWVAPIVNRQNMAETCDMVISSKVWSEAQALANDLRREFRRD